MNIINNVNASATYPSSSTAGTSSAGEFETNSRQFGPAAASLIGAVKAAGNASTSVYTFSADALNKLSESAEAAFDAVKGAVTNTADAIGGAVTSVEDAAGSAVQLAKDGIHAVEDGAGYLYDKAGDMVQSAENAVSSAVASVGDAIGGAVDNVESAAGEVAGYVAMGVAAGKKLLSELA